MGLVDRETETEGQILRTREVKRTLEKYEYCHNQTSLYYLLVVNEFLVFKESYPSKPFTVVRMQSVLLRQLHITKHSLDKVPHNYGK